MRCDEIQEHLIDLLYEDATSSPESIEARDHLRGCLMCRQELENLRGTRKYLQEWKDETPPRSIVFARQELVSKRQNRWRFLRYGAVAAMALICFLALANTKITWTDKEFSVRTSLFGQAAESRPEYYTKSEVRDLMKRALDDTEIRMTEDNYLLMQKILDTVERERWMDLRQISMRPLAHGSAVRGGNN